ncbi:uncharacterized protein K452DRAFT_37620 [Aplosporella prunicola CBS 121167]|uniref:Uncharacterized protein n=1 Tax=Aplosporella prunicola CBS 121167 TaxID=1176127 RepID=A0A6A6BCG4_9PEZI|nr:uncharacterized protein K452DRAFT_37620 [Aplosporella prunicola CBS 121167]KAF2141288.1 hypothetical protein K452DRAFT_37620 [Aplosporella prunicola CBS 121167]
MSEPSILIGLHYRGRLSLGEHRARLGFAAFHWSIIIVGTPSDPHKIHRFDVTDGFIFNDDGTDANPTRDWIFQHQTTNSLAEITRYLGAVRVGKVLAPRMSAAEELKLFFEALPLPRKENAEGEEEQEQNCVSWVRAAVRALETSAWCQLAEQPLNLDDLMGFALTHADTRIRDLIAIPDVIDYPRQEKKREGAVRALISYIKRPRKG